MTLHTAFFNSIAKRDCRGLFPLHCLSWQEGRLCRSILGASFGCSPVGYENEMGKILALI